ncbi:MAG: type IV secretion system protein [Hydrogenophaga sp.]|jgi:type IV secretion system protein VirB5|nr:type IV secretion system protein [Hydrogenophaga sp.]
MRHVRRAAVALLVTASASQAQAGPLAVIDVANLAQAVQQVTHHITQIQHQLQQIQQLQTQIDSMNGPRNLGDVHHNLLLTNYVPAQAFTHLNAVATSGYNALSASAKALRDADMSYNCLDLAGAEQIRCQAALAQPYQHKGLLQDAMTRAAGRLGQIQALMNEVNTTTDQKSVLEMQARLGAENALLAHETSQLQMLQAMADSEERIARSRDRERQYEMLNRTGKLADFLP